MKRILVLFLALSILMLAACSDNSETKNAIEETDDQSEERLETDKQKEKEDKIYQIGETEVITSDIYDFDYEVTVTDFTITDEVDGVNISDQILGLLEDDPSRFAVVDVTIKNISDESYIPNEMFSANFSLVDEEAGVVSIEEFFPEGDEELAPGEEVSGHIVYTHELDDEEAYWVKYEVMSDNEGIFELPNPAK